MHELVHWVFFSKPELQTVKKTQCTKKNTRNSDEEPLKSTKSTIKVSTLSITNAKIHNSPSPFRAKTQKLKIDALLSHNNSTKRIPRVENRRERSTTRKEGVSKVIANWPLLKEVDAAEVTVILDEREAVSASEAAMPAISATKSVRYPNPQHEMLQKHCNKLLIRRSAEEGRRGALGRG